MCSFIILSKLSQIEIGRCAEPYRNSTMKLVNAISAMAAALVLLAPSTFAAAPDLTKWFISSAANSYGDSTNCGAGNKLFVWRSDKFMEFAHSYDTLDLLFP